MAKKSASSLSVVSIAPKDSRLPPPDTLNPEQRALWLAIVAAKPSDWFTVDTAAFLFGYVNAIYLHSIFTKDVLDAIKSKADPVDMKTLCALQAQQAQLIQSFGTKMRLTPQSRYTTLSAGTAYKKASGARPWD